MFDGSEETCWNSAEGLPQHVTIDFGRAVLPSRMRIVFQGGFAGRECAFLAGDGDALAPLNAFAPTDSNLPQEFDIECPTPVRVLRVLFQSSTDLFGRIVVYSLDILGRDA
eukprot:m.106762 g.106762  ORF g.106762 m.106762 type:complete len:111 (-) comp8955_c2_seq1:2155-2487(-)